MRKSSKEPEFLITEQEVIAKSSIAKEFLAMRKIQNETVDRFDNKLLKRIYNVDHNAYLEGGALSAKTKELMGLVASTSLRCEDCIYYHVIQSYRLGASIEELQESLNISTVVGGTIVVPYLRKAYALIDELFES